MILVTGATGNNGPELLKSLAQTGAAFRAMIHKGQDRESPSLRGVECVEADFDDFGAVRRALEGVQQAFLVTHSSPHAERRQLAFVEAARAAGLRHIVYLSQLHAALDSPVRFLRYHAAVENAIASSGIAFTHLRPNLYMQGLLEFRSSIVSRGCFFAPAGDTRVSIVDVRDIAAVAAAVLTQPGHKGRVYNITGPEALTHAEMASWLSQVLGRPISYVNVSETAMRAALLQFGVPHWQAEGVVEDYAHYRRGEASEISTAVQDVTGHLPHSFAAFASDYREMFQN